MYSRSDEVLDSLKNPKDSDQFVDWFSLQTAAVRDDKLLVEVSEPQQAKIGHDRILQFAV